MSDEDIGIAADWDGQPEQFCTALKAVGFLEGDSSSYSIHDWCEHQPYAAARGERIECARNAARIRHASAAHAERMRIECATSAPNQSNPNQSKPKNGARVFEDRSQPLSDSDCGIAICTLLSFSGLKLPREVSEAVPIIRDTLSFKDNWQVFDFLPEKWRAYEQSNPKVRMGFERWLSTAQWKDGEKPRVNGQPVRRKWAHEITEEQLAAND